MRLTLLLAVAVLAVALAGDELALRRMHPLWAIPYPPVCYRPGLFQRWDPYGYRLWPSRTTQDRYPKPDGRLVTIVSNAHNPLAFGGQSAGMSDLRERELAWLGKLPPPEREVAAARAEVRYTLGYMVAHPRQELGLAPWRVYYLYAGDHYALPPRRVLVLRWADAYFFAAVALALVGTMAAVPLASPSALVLPLTVAYVTVLHGVVFFGDSRYHAPLVPVLSILAAVGLDVLWRRVKRSGLPAATESSP